MSQTNSVNAGVFRSRELALHRLCIRRDQNRAARTRSRIAQV